MSFELWLAEVLQHIRNGVKHVAVADNLWGLRFDDPALRVGLYLSVAWLFRCSEQFSQQQVFTAYWNIGKLNSGQCFGFGQISDAHCLVDKLLDLLQQAQLDDHDLLFHIYMHLLSHYVFLHLLRKQLVGRRDLLFWAGAIVDFWQRHRLVHLLRGFYKAAPLCFDWPDRWADLAAVRLFISVDTVVLLDTLLLCYSLISASIHSLLPQILLHMCLWLSSLSRDCASKQVTK